MAAAFAEVDFVISATNPGPAFPADAATSQTQSRVRRLGQVDAGSWPGHCGRLLFGTRAGQRRGAEAARRASSARRRERFPDLVNMGGLTIISNIYGNPAVSIPAGTVDGLPVGMQVLGRHHEDDLLFDVALAVERERPWPLVAPAAMAASTLA